MMIGYMNGTASAAIAQQCYPNEHKTWSIYEDSTSISNIPYFFRQVLLITVCIRLFLLLTGPARLPPFVAESLAGVTSFFLGYSLLNPSWVFPPLTLSFLEAAARWGLIYYGFLIGLEVDVKVLSRPPLQPLAIALVAIPVSIPIGVLGALGITMGSGHFTWGNALVCGSVLATTSTATVTDMLAKLKLLNAPISRMALTSGLLGDAYAWFILVVLISLKNPDKTQLGYALVFVAFIFWAIHKIKKKWPRLQVTVAADEDLTSFQVSFVLILALLAAVMIDLWGMHGVVGTYLFGLAVPRGTLVELMREKLEYMVVRIWMPLFYCVSGMRAAYALVAISDLNHLASLFMWALIIALGASLVRVAVVFAASFWSYQPRQSVALGLILNGKGVIPLLFINIAWEKEVISTCMYGIFYFAFLLMTVMITPLLRVCYTPVKHYALYIYRTVDRAKIDSEFRVLACLQSLDNISGISHLLQMSNSSSRSPIVLFTLQLVELAHHHAAPMLFAHDMSMHGGGDYATSADPDIITEESDSDKEYVKAFVNFEQENDHILVNPFTSICDPSSMYEDICNLAEDKRAAIILLPFQALRGTSKEEEKSASCAETNRRVLGCAPCTVGIFVDRGFKPLPQEEPEEMTEAWSDDDGFGYEKDPNFDEEDDEEQVLVHNPCRGRNIAMLFFFGADDREALAYAWRMARRQGVSLTVWRFILSDDVDDLDMLGEIKGNEFEVIAEYEKQKRKDDQCVGEFRMRTHGNVDITFQERVVKSPEDTVTSIRDMDHSQYDLYVVGRSERVLAPFTVGLMELADRPELGPIGDVLVSSDFSPEVSVLVVQKYKGVQASWDERRPVADRFKKEPGEVR